MSMVIKTGATKHRIIIALPSYDEIYRNHNDRISSFVISFCKRYARARCNGTRWLQWVRSEDGHGLYKDVLREQLRNRVASFRTIFYSELKYRTFENVYSMYEYIEERLDSFYGVDMCSYQHAAEVVTLDDIEESGIYNISDFVCKNELDKWRDNHARKLKHICLHYTKEFVRALMTVQEIKEELT